MYALTSISLASFLSHVKLPPLADGVLEGKRHLVDVALVDDPAIDDVYVLDVIKPMVMVLARHLPRAALHRRLIINRDGFLAGHAGSGQAYAGHVK